MTDAWEQLWKARMQALASVLGEPDDIVGHALIPFEMGADIGGAADLLYFRKNLDGVAAVTAGLIGCEEQKPNVQGNYELMIAARSDEELESWAGLISRMAYYTLEIPLQPGETMALDGSEPQGSTIQGLLFCDYGRIVVEAKPCGILLGVGITGDEILACRAGHWPIVEEALRANGIFPFTDTYRASAIEPRYDDEPSDDQPGFFARLFRRS